MTPLKTATLVQLQSARHALRMLQSARDCLIQADCPKTVERVRLAITSAGGAVRHCERRFNKLYEKERATAAGD